MKKPIIIQFLHPGKQYNIDFNKAAWNKHKYKFFDDNKIFGIKYWNNKQHRRKFLKSKGNFISYNDGLHYENQDILFWGEWEPHSIFEIIKQNNKEETPNHVHTPFYSNEITGIQNTDPFVFGNCFLYSNCQQSSKIMRNLPNGSLILFGSEINIENKLEFVLDTVFVIKDSIKICKSNLKLIKKRTSKLFIDTVLRKISLENNFRLYFSVTYDEKEDFGMYSYFPCKKYNKNNYFRRPILNFEDFKLKKPGSRCGYKYIENIKAIDYWEKVSEVLLNKNYNLGTKANLPKEINIKNIFVNNNIT